MPFGRCPVCGIETHYRVIDTEKWVQRVHGARVAPLRCSRCRPAIKTGDRVELRDPVSGRSGNLSRGDRGTVDKVWKLARHGDLYWTKMDTGDFACLIRAEILRIDLRHERREPRDRAIIHPEGNYILGNYIALLNAAERKAYDAYYWEVEGGEYGEGLKPLAELSSDPEIKSLVRNGERAFYEAIVNRLVKECGDQIIVNKCQKCGDFCLPKAQQCLNCGYDWHKR
jgi:hypothetical protein